MSKTVFDQIREGLNEALAVARGEQDPYKLLHIPREIEDNDVRAETGARSAEASS